MAKQTFLGGAIVLLDSGWTDPRLCEKCGVDIAGDRNVNGVGGRGQKRWCDTCCIHTFMALGSRDDSDEQCIRCGFTRKHPMTR